MQDILTAEIPLTQGRVAIVDRADLDKLAGLTWRAVCLNGHWYAQTSIPGVEQPVFMHRYLTDCPAGKLVDHADGDGLNNRRANMRVCTHTENMWNQRAQATGRKVSRFKGVTWKPRGKPWAAAIQQRGERLYIGSYRTEEEAARAYDAAAKVFHGRFACTNAGMGLFEPKAA